MKKAILSMAGMVLLLSSCDTTTKDSYQTLNFRENNLLIDNQDPSADAVASLSDYDVKYNISRNCVDVKTSDIIINNQKYSFETDTMALRQKFFTVEGNTSYNLTFSKRGNVGAGGTGSAVSNLTGTFVSCYVPPQYFNPLNPDFTVSVATRLDLSYTLSDRYSVQTFWAAGLFLGQTVATDGGESYSTKGSNYIVQLDFEKKKGSVYVYNAEFSADNEKKLPRVILFEDIPIVFSHNGFSLSSSAPKTTVLGTKDNKTEMVESEEYAATDFSMQMTSADLTEIYITYKLAGKNVSFRGCSILKGN